MKTSNKKMAVQSTSTAIEDEQPLNEINNIISNKQGNINTLNENALKTMTLEEIYDTTFIPKKQIIKNFLYSGVYLFVGAPKIGKSYFMAQLGYCVSKGIDLWEYKVRQGTVLYLALEDDYSRIQKRLLQMYGVDTENIVQESDQATIETCHDYHFCIKSQSINDGLLLQFKNFIDEHKKTSLIIVDTLQKIRDVGGENYNYASDYDIISKLKRFADENNICILIVHHTRKLLTNDSFDSISGTNGLLGASDGAFVMYKNERIKDQATIDLAGRDCPDQRLNIRKNEQTCLWELVSLGNNIVPEPENPHLKKIVNLFKDGETEWSGTATELLIEIEVTGIKPNAFTRKLNSDIETLLNEYNVRMTSKRSGKGTIFTFSLIK